MVLFIGSGDVVSPTDILKSAKYALPLYIFNQPSAPFTEENSNSAVFVGKC